MYPLSPFIGAIVSYVGHRQLNTSLVSWHKNSSCRRRILYGPQNFNTDNFKKIFHFNFLRLNNSGITLGKYRRPNSEDSIKTLKNPPPAAVIFLSAPWPSIQERCVDLSWRHSLYVMAHHLSWEKNNPRAETFSSISNWSI